MTSFEDIESIIAEWFSDYAIHGNVEVAKLYAHLEKEIDKNLSYHLNEKEQKKK